MGRGGTPRALQFKPGPVAANAIAPSPPDDTAGRASAGCPDRTGRPPQPPEQYDPRPTATAAPGSSSAHTATAPQPGSPREPASTPHRSPPCRLSKTRTLLGPEQTPAPADIPDRSAAATGPRNSPSRTSCAAWPGSPARTTGRAPDRSAQPAEPPPASGRQPWSASAEALSHSVASSTEDKAPPPPHRVASRVPYRTITTTLVVAAATPALDAVTVTV
jgi:hypothetical protein